MVQRTVSASRLPFRREKKLVKSADVRPPSAVKVRKATTRLLR